MILRTLALVFTVVCIFIQPAEAHRNKSVGMLDVADVSFDPSFIKIGPRPNFIEITVKLAESPYMREPEVLFLKQLKALPNGQPLEKVVGVLKKNKKNAHPSANDLIYAGTAVIQEKVSGELKFRIDAEYRGDKAASSVFTKLAGSVFAPGEGGRVQGSDGISVTIPPDSIPFEAQVAVISAGQQDIQAPLGDETPVLGVFKLDIEPVQGNVEVTSLQKPLQVSFFASTETTIADFFILARELDVPLPGSGDEQGGIVKRLTPVDTAIIESPSNRIVTDSSFYKGVLGSGVYVLLDHVGSGNIQGYVCEGNIEPCPAGATKAPSVVVINNTNGLVAVTDNQGKFQLFINGDAPDGKDLYQLTAFDNLRGYLASKNGMLPQGTDIALLDRFSSTPSLNTALTGIRNGGFECVSVDANDSNSGDFCDGYWKRESADIVKLIKSLKLCAVPNDGSSLDVSCPADSSALIGEIKPSEGQWMAFISSGTSNEVNQFGSRLSQRLKVPSKDVKLVDNVPTDPQVLHFDYMFLSEEFNEFVNTEFNDVFQAVVTRVPPAACDANHPEFCCTAQNIEFCPKPIKVVSVNDPGTNNLLPCTNIYGQAANCLPETAIFNCGFSGGDSTCGKIPFVVGADANQARRDTINKWATADIDLSAYAGQNITLELVFTASDKGDDVYNTYVLLDNLRFNTVFLHVNDVNNALPGNRANLDFCNTPLECVQHDLYHFVDKDNVRHYGANEILSLAGVNLRLQDERVDSLIPVNTTLKAIMAESRGPAPISTCPSLHYANVYYVTPSMVANSAAAETFAREDYPGSVTRFINDGIGIAAEKVSGCTWGGDILAHELGHLLMISGFDSTDEHKASGTYVMDGCSNLWAGATQYINSNQQIGSI